MITLHNWKNTHTQNVYHFQGKSKYHYSEIFKQTANCKLVNNNKIICITCATDEELSPLIKQYKNSNIPFYNAYSEQFYSGWINTMKISIVISILEKLNADDVVLFTDGYDVAIRSLDDLYDKFIHQPYKVLFNATKHNHPNVKIDKMPNRDSIGEFCYFNAGCVIGYVKYLLQFYKECYAFLKEHPTNPWNSEQWVIRNIWANYSEDTNGIIGIDYDCTIFQTFGSTRLEKINENNYKVT